MKTTDTPTPLGAERGPEQLSFTLAPSASVPLQFRLDERTRRAGLRHVAELRAQMAAQAARRASAKATAIDAAAPSRQIAA